MRRAPAVVALALVAACAVAAAAPARAAVYRFTDEQGVVHYSNVPNDPRFREVKGSAPPPPALSSGAGMSAERYEEEITRLCADHGVDSNLVKAVIKAESNYDNRAISRAGAQGLMQLMPGTARLRNVDNPFNPEQNIDGGIRHLKELLATFGDTRLALAAYNAGEGAVRKYNGIPPYPETQNYVKTVLSHYGRYSAPGSGKPGAPAPPPQIQCFVNAEGVRVFTNTPWRYLESPEWRKERGR